MKASQGREPVFDEPNLVSAAGLLPVLRLAERAGLASLVARAVTVPVANVSAKVNTVIAGMLAGADSIDDLDVLRSGGTARLLDGGVRAPSTIGTFLRSFTHGHVLQLHKVARGVLTGLAAKVPTLVGADDVVFVDLDDTIREVHGYAKQGAGFGYSGVRGLNALIATISAPSTAPVIAECSLRKGSTRSGKSAAWHLTRALATTARITTSSQQVWVRGDSAFCTLANVTAAVNAVAWFSFTIPAWPTVKAAISRIEEQEWTPIGYPRAVRDEETGDLISEAEVAEVPFVAFTSKTKDQQVVCRLIVRRVKRLNDAATAGQDELFTTWRYHAFITNTTLGKVDADRVHRGHAIVEQVIAELKDGPLAHLPSGKFAANGAWLALAVIAFNLSRAAAHAATMPAARMATVRRTLITVPARLASTGRRLLIHMPARWPWQTAWTNLWDTATAPPPAATH